MKTPRALTVLFTILLLLLLSAIATTASPYGKGPGGAYEYRVDNRNDGSVEVSVIANLDDPRTLERYMAANRERIETLLVRRSDTPVYVQVTFSQPVSHEAAHQLSQATSLTVSNYAMVGVDRQGQPLTVIINDSLDAGIPIAQDLAIDENQEVIDGIMVIQGTITATDETLGELVRNPSVYLVDTTAFEVQEAVMLSHNLGVSEIESVALPSPAWALRWGPPD